MKNDKKPLLLITGGAGYVGSNLIREALISGYRVRCLDFLIYGGKSIVGLVNHPDFELYVGDVRKGEDLKNALDGVDEVVHLAAIVGDRPCQVAPKLAYQTNFESTQKIIELSIKSKIKKFIFASTCSNYGAIEGDAFADEKTKLNPVSLYSETKIDCEKFITQNSTDEFQPIILRFGTAYGVSFRTRFDLTVNSFVYEALNNDQLLVFAPNMWRPFVHVHDMSRIILTVLNSENVAGKIFNAGSTEENYTKQQMIEFILKNVNNVKVHYAKEIEDKRNYRVNCDFLRDVTGFKPTRTVESGIIELIHCFKNGILNVDDYEQNKLDSLAEFYKKQEKILT
ncbi:MAG: NAD(P)-dependent oxidoreductase [Leptospiraceae bacterium]|nr:NAD(P)-dependent oxidoreductase [Leptospiraceae bacterium]